MTFRRALVALSPALLLVAQATPAMSQSASLANPAALTEKAPASYKVKFDTSKGPIIVQVQRDWSPNGADRFYNLVKNGFYDQARFFRVATGFVVQFGISGDPRISAPWREARIADDPVRQSNKRGTITFATSGANSRTTQVFINLRDNDGLDSRGFSPFGRISTGMNVVDGINPEYGETPNQGAVQMEGNAYLTKNFPRMDFIRKATIEP